MRRLRTASLPMLGRGPPEEHALPTQAPRSAATRAEEDPGPAPWSAARRHPSKTASAARSSSAHCCNARIVARFAVASPPVVTAPTPLAETMVMSPAKEVAGMKKSTAPVIVATAATVFEELATPRFSLQTLMRFSNFANSSFRFWIKSSSEATSAGNTPTAAAPPAAGTTATAPLPMPRASAASAETTSIASSRRRSASEEITASRNRRVASFVCKESILGTSPLISTTAGPSIGTADSRSQRRTHSSTVLAART
mmetsp:Transcript_66057/g.182912  ORF Transcript_66057/g.182912 Transcript_66057/m.182912 type:complete len:256 (-) Transcript_66057:429-1196(-)